MMNQVRTGRIDVGRVESTGPHRMGEVSDDTEYGKKLAARSMGILAHSRASDRRSNTKATRRQRNHNTHSLGVAWGSSTLDIRLCGLGVCPTIHTRQNVVVSRKYGVKGSVGLEETMITKVKIEGTMVEIPPAYAPGSFYHPLPTLACMENCIRECFPGVASIKMVDSIKNHDVTITARITHRYMGDAVRLFVGSLLDVIKRHIPKTRGSHVFFLLDLEPEAPHASDQ